MTYKPVILIGNGGRRQGLKDLTPLNIPILSTWMAADMIAEDNPSFCGRPGRLGQRAANIIQQQATHLYVFGARLDGEQVAYDYDRFAPDAKIFVVEIDTPEFDKYPDRYERVAMNVDFDTPDDRTWVDECRALYDKYRYELDGWDELDPFSFVRLLSEAGEPDDVFAIGSSGFAPTSFYQAFKVKEGQRISNCCTIGAMGADIPMALGAALGSGKRTICYTGDGGFHLNTQELTTIKKYSLPITFFVLNNNGYASIRNMQDARFEGRHVGCDPESGLTLPDLQTVADGYGIMCKEIKTLADFEGFASFPIIYEVFVDPDWKQLPVVGHTIVDGEYQVDDMDNMTPKLKG